MEGFNGSTGYGITANFSTVIFYGHDFKRDGFHLTGVLLNGDRLDTTLRSNFSTIEFRSSVVPEPSSLLALGLFSAAVLRRRSRKNAK